jgi:hypothetical protein
VVSSGNSACRAICAQIRDLMRRDGRRLVSELIVHILIE